MDDAGALREDMKGMKTVKDMKKDMKKDVKKDVKKDIH
jgi:hypothetical protein